MAHFSEWKAESTVPLIHKTSLYTLSIMTLSTMYSNKQFISVFPARLGAPEIQDHVLFTVTSQHLVRGWHKCWAEINRNELCFPCLPQCIFGRFQQSLRVNYVQILGQLDSQWRFLPNCLFLHSSFPFPLHFQREFPLEIAQLFVQTETASLVPVDLNSIMF